jgi:hypothetical protein
MSHEPMHPPSDSELDRLLASQPRRTSREFEQRWREVRAGLGQRPKPLREWWHRWWMLPGVATAALAAAALVVVPQLRTPAPAVDLVAFEELIALDAALARATPLLDPENRDALLFLPLQPRL